MKETNQSCGSLFWQTRNSTGKRLGVSGFDGRLVLLLLFIQPDDPQLARSQTFIQPWLQCRATDHDPSSHSTIAHATSRPGYCAEHFAGKESLTTISPEGLDSDDQLTSWLNIDQNGRAKHRKANFGPTVLMPYCGRESTMFWELPATCNRFCHSLEGIPSDHLPSGGSFSCEVSQPCGNIDGAGKWNKTYLNQCHLCRPQLN